MKELLSSLSSGLFDHSSYGPWLIRSSEASNKQNEVRYLQSQNDNLRLSSSKPTGEFEGIRNDVPSDIEWATEALGEDYCSPTRLH